MLIKVPKLSAPFDEMNQKTRPTGNNAPKRYVGCDWSSLSKPMMPPGQDIHSVSGLNRSELAAQINATEARARYIANLQRAREAELSQSLDAPTNTMNELFTKLLSGVRKAEIQQMNDAYLTEQQKEMLNEQALMNKVKMDGSVLREADALARAEVAADEVLDLSRLRSSVPAVAKSAKVGLGRMFDDDDAISEAETLQDEGERITAPVDIVKEASIKSKGGNVDDDLNSIRQAFMSARKSKETTAMNAAGTRLKRFAKSRGISLVQNALGRKITQSARSGDMVAFASAVNLIRETLGSRGGGL